MKNADRVVEGGIVTPGNVQVYARYGFLVAPGILSPSEIEKLKGEAVRIFRGDYGAVEGIKPVEAGETDADMLKKYVAIHFPHKISPVIHEFLGQRKVVEVLTKVIGDNVKCMQSMLFVKGPGKAGQSWHQDEYYIPTRDKSLTGAWLAIDDATIENGCLWIIPGSHLPGFIMKRVADHSDEYADVDTVDVSSFSNEEIIPVEVKAGSIVFFNGYVLHSSLRNKTKDNFRMALVNHYMSAESMLPWDQDGKLPPSEDMRDIVVVAGEDPYSYKPIVDLNKPYLRPEVLKIKIDDPNLGK